MSRGYRRLQGDNRLLQWVIGGYKQSQRVKRCYGGLQRVKRDLKGLGFWLGLQGVTWGYGGLQGVTGVYRGRQGVTKG